MPKVSHADLRREFWSLPDEAYVSRDMAAACMFLAVASMEAMAMKGDGPKYLARGRGKATLYRKKDIIEWLEGSGRVVSISADSPHGGPKA